MNARTGNFYDFCVRRHVLERPDAPAVIAGKVTLSYAQLHTLCLRRMRTLERHGCGPESVPCLLFENPLELAVTALALTRMGCPLFVVQKSLPERQRDAWMQLAHSRTVLSDSPLDWVKAGEQTFLQVSLAQEAGTPAEDGPGPEIPEDRCLLLIGGSGSTGDAKLIAVTQAQLRHRLIDMIETLTLKPDDLMLSAFALEYASGVHLFLSTLASGACSVIRVPDRDIVGWMQRNRVGVMVAGSVHIEQMLKLAEGRPAPVLPDLRVLALGGSTVSDALRKRIADRLTENLYVIWGSNEVWYATVATPPMVRAKAGTIGRATNRSRVEVVGPDGTLVGVDEVGELRVSSPSVANGYVGADATANKAFRDGWFYPGDLGRLLDDGQIAFLGRKDNLMIMDGVNIHPAEIERCALEYPGVGEAFAFPFRHPVHQDVPCCAVSPAAESSCDLEGLGRYLARELGGRRPRVLYLFDSLPRSAQGKIVRKEITQLVMARSERQSLSL